jgi:hypothetical protein
VKFVRGKRLYLQERELAGQELEAVVLQPGRFAPEVQELLMVVELYSADLESKEDPLNPAQEYQQKTGHG